MPIRHAIWKVGNAPEQLPEGSLDSESLLEEMIVGNPAILSDRWMLIGRQVHTTHDGIVDLLALNQDGQLIVIELKRRQTAREVVAQALDYASWAQQLTADEVAAIYGRFSGGGLLGEAFQRRFSTALDEEQLNDSHQIVVVASSLDPSTERIVNYLNGRNVGINIIFFQVFQGGDNKYLSRAWLIDPVETEIHASAGGAGTGGNWNGEYYVSFGQGEDRDWAEAMQYGFICGGGGPWYSQTLSLLSPGNRVWVNVPGRGYVGVGRVRAPVVKASEFEVEIDGARRFFLEIARANYHREKVDNEEECEYFVPVEWLVKKPLEQAMREVGFFGNQNTVARPTTPKWNHTIDRLKHFFEIRD